LRRPWGVLAWEEQSREANSETWREKRAGSAQWIEMTWWENNVEQINYTMLPQHRTARLEHFLKNVMFPIGKLHYKNAFRHESNDINLIFSTT